MSEKTKIQWCDSTINFWRGCTKVSPGCANCYAESLSKRTGHGLYQRGVPREHVKSAVKEAIKLNWKPWVCDSCGDAIEGKDFSPSNPALAKPSHRCGINGCQGQSWHRRRIFTNSLADMFDPEVPIEWLAEAMDTIRQCDQVIWIICTKRPELWYRRLYDCLDLGIVNCWFTGETGMWIDAWIKGKPPANIWLLTSVENQAMADQRIPDLLKIPAICRGLSVEPMLGQVEFSDFTGRSDAVMQLGKRALAGIDWAIFGGESGPNARPCNVEWIRSGVKQCQTAGVAAFVKQLGAKPYTEHDYKPDYSKSQMPLDLKDKKGGDMAEWPEDLKIREFPKL